MDLATARFLCSVRARPALKDLQNVDLTESQTLSCLTELRQTFTPTEAGALLTLARLRQHARHKFSQAEQLFFTTESLEQATAWTVAERRAEQIDAYTAPGSLLDLGCGIGGDTIALAQKRSVIAYEYDPVRLCFAQANVAALGLADQVEFRQADWVAELAAGTLPRLSTYVDPVRRRHRRRVFSLHQIEPPLAILAKLWHHAPCTVIKCMPGVKDVELPTGCGVEFISHAGTCKEAVLWFVDELAGLRWATVHTQNHWLRLEAHQALPPTGPVAPGHYLHEPDPAVIRAGAFAELCQQMSAWLLDAQIAYLVSNATPTGLPPEHELVQTFRILEVHPMRLKLLNRRLAALQIGTVELKKRGVPIEPEALRKRLKLVPQGDPGVVIFTRQGNKRLMLICERM